MKTPSLGFGRNFSLDCRSFRRTAVSLARLLAPLAVSFLFVGLLLGPLTKTYPGSSLDCRGVREDPFAGLRPELVVGLPFFSSDCRFSSAVARFARWTAVIFVGLLLGPFLKTSPGSSLGCRGAREDPFAGLRPELFVGLPFFSSDFCSGRFTKHLLVPAWAAEECVKTPSLAFGWNFLLDCRSFRRTSARAVVKNISWFQPGLQRSA